MTKVSNHVAIVNFAQKDDDWWTPPWLADTCRSALGGHIDLDPCSCLEANKTIRATKIFTKADNGLAQPWIANTLFINPPSKRGDPLAQPKLWAERLLLYFANRTVKAATLIVKSNLGYAWYEQLYRLCWVCHLRERPHFLKDGLDVGQAKKGVSVFYLGPKPILFYDLFIPHGRVVPPETWVDNKV